MKSSHLALLRAAQVYQGLRQRQAAALAHQWAPTDWAARNDAAELRRAGSSDIYADSTGQAWQRPDDDLVTAAWERFIALATTETIIELVTTLSPEATP